MLIYDLQAVIDERNALRVQLRDAAASIKHIQHMCARERAVWHNRSDIDGMQKHIDFVKRCGAMRVCWAC